MNHSNDNQATASDNAAWRRQPGPAGGGRIRTTYEYRPDGAAHGPLSEAVQPVASDTSRSAHLLRQLVGVVALAALVGCGSMPGERAVSGAGIGAGAGAALGAVTGMGVGTGAAIGAAAGAAAGGLTKKKQVDLGEPVWKR